MSKNNIVAELEERVDQLVSVRPVPPLVDRFRTVKDVAEDFFIQTGHQIPSYIVSKLTDWVLVEILNDKDVDKVSNSEYAILSPRQLRRRDKRENSVEGDVMDYLNLKFTKHTGSLSKKVKRVQE